MMVLFGVLFRLLITLGALRLTLWFRFRRRGLRFWWRSRRWMLVRFVRRVVWHRLWGLIGLRLTLYVTRLRDRGTWLMFWVRSGRLWGRGNLWGWRRCCLTVCRRVIWWRVSFGYCPCGRLEWFVRFWLWVWDLLMLMIGLLLTFMLL